MKAKFAAGELRGFSDPEIQAKAKAAVLKKYGVANVSQVPEVRQKMDITFQEKFGGPSPMSSAEVRAKNRETNLDRYGKSNVFAAAEVKAKIQQTLQERYGVQNATLAPEIREKQIASMVRNHGVKQPLQKPAILKKQQETLQERYGVENSSQILRVAEQTRNRLLLVSDSDFERFVRSSDEAKLTIDEICAEFGYVSPSPVYKRLKKLGLQEHVVKNKSSANAYWQAKLEDALGVELSTEGRVFMNARERCDLYHEDFRVAIDINPTISHSTQNIHPVFKPKTVKYHQDRALSAEANGWLLYQIYDWSDEQQAVKQLRNLFKCNQEKVAARKCAVVRPSKTEASKFLLENHGQGNAAIGNVFYGLSYDGELVQIMTFSAERFRGSENGYELIRLASRGTVVGGASRLFSHFVQDFSPKRVKTFASLDTGQGKVYETLGFRFDKLAGLNALYSKPDSGEAYKVTQCSQKFRKLYEPMGLTQQEFMNSKGFYRINDAGNKIYIWTNEGRHHG